MALVLKALDPPGATRTIDSGKSFSMGRGSDNDWVLVDPGREISKTHCRIEADGPFFVLIDLSINGVLIDGKSGPMGPGSRHRLGTGDIFQIGQHRFGVAVGEGDIQPEVPNETAPSLVSHILDGGSEGSETRASGGVSGESDRWLNTLPKGSADDTLREPMGWEEPPSTGGTILPLDFDHTASDFANRSEHIAAPNSALHLPRAQQTLPMDWMSAEDMAPRATPASFAPKTAMTPQTKPAFDVRGPLADGSRLDRGILAPVADDALLQRCGEALRALLDGLDTIEAAQAVAERDCGLPAAVDGGLWTDFFATNSDPLVSLLVENQPGPAAMVAQRVAALADRQRALGHAIAAAAATYDAKLAPEPIASAAKSRFAVGPFAKAAAWRRFADLHAELAAQYPGESMPSFLLLLRKSFSRAMTKRP